MTNIYFIENANGEIKIGRSEDVISRLRQLQTGNSSNLKLRFTINEVKETFEAHIHEIVQAYHIQGEWFKSGAITHLQKVPFFKETMIPVRHKKIPS